MDEVSVSVGKDEQKKSRGGVIRAFRDGKTPTFEQIARSRGMVIRERENSIFSDAWIPIAILAILIGIIANRDAAMMAIGIGLIIMAIISRWWRDIALLGVSYERTFDRSHVFPGERVVLTVTANNHKLLPLTWLEFRDQAPIAPLERGKMIVSASEVSGRYSMQNAFSMNSFGQASRNATFAFPRRGYYKFGPVRYLSGDLFTLFTIDREYRDLDNLVVYPTVWPLETLELPAKEMFGEITVHSSLFTDPIKTQGIRSYQPQDRFRDIHWKASARRGDLQTKVYDPISGMSIVTFLNVATFEKHWMGFDPGLLERAVSVTASICNYAAQQKWGVGVFANGSVPGSDQPIRVQPGHSPDQLMAILEALAAVTEFATGSIERLMHQESNRLPWTSTLVLVTGILTEPMLASMLRLKKAGRRITIISLADDPPPRNRQGLLIYHVPASLTVFEDDIYSRSPTESTLASIPVPGDSPLV